MSLLTLASQKMEVVEISGKFEMEDFAGVTETVFKEMSKLWPNRRKK